MMSFKILFVTATGTEAETLKKTSGLKPVRDKYMCGNLEINLLITGIGSVATAWAMKQWLSLNGKPDLAINAGIAGSYNDELLIGDIIMPVSDCFADSGIEDNHEFYTLPEAGLTSADEYPYKGGFLIADTRYSKKLNGIARPVKAITVNTATGSDKTRNKLFRKFSPDIETMEGATFFYVCIMEKIPFFALRSISNKVEPRDKSKWNVPLALDNLSEKLQEVMFVLK
jgi:futalosine hydrolase